MYLRYLRDAGELQILLKQSYCICRREEDAEAILDPPLHIPPDEGIHLRGALLDMWFLGDGGLQRLERPWGTGVYGYSLLSIGPE